jgi:uncharacterized protein YprB with RNaseH-like and TPR domain
VVVCDIETSAILDAEQYLTEPLDAPSNWKDPAKIAQYIEDKRKEQLDRCALDPDLARIVAIGYAFHDGDSVFIQTARDQNDEQLMLEQFWRNTKGHLYVTFAGLRFDLPVLMRRSQYLRVPYRTLNVDRYRSPHVDLANRLSFYGVLPAHSLKFYCARFGITCDDLTMGKDVPGLVAAGDWPAVEAHCRADVLATKALANRLGYLTLTPEHLAESA